MFNFTTTSKGYCKGLLYQSVCLHWIIIETHHMNDDSSKILGYLFMAWGLNITGDSPVFFVISTGEIIQVASG